MSNRQQNEFFARQSPLCPTDSKHASHLQICRFPRSPLSVRCGATEDLRVSEAAFLFMGET